MFSIFCMSYNSLLIAQYSLKLTIISELMLYILVVDLF